METTDELIKEYLLFRGFFNTFRNFDLESKNDRDKGFKAELVVEQLFSYINSSDINELLEFWKYLDSRFFSQIDSRFCMTLKRMEISLLKYYIVVQIQKNKKDKILEFYNILGNELLGKSEWDHNWFAIPFIKKPESNPLFKIYFSKQWLETFTSSLTNFLNTIFQNITLPSLLNFNTDRYIRKAQECEIQALRNLIDNLKTELDASDNKITSLRQMLSQNYNPITEKELNPIHENLKNDNKDNPIHESLKNDTKDNSKIKDITNESQQKKSNKKDDANQVNVIDSKINDDVIYEMKNLTDSEHRIMMLNQDLIHTFSNKLIASKISTNMGNIVSCIDNKNKVYLYNIETSSCNSFDDLPSEYTVMEWGNKSDNIINIGLKNNNIRSINTNTKSFKDIQILNNYCTSIEYSNNNNDYIYSILQNPNETNIGLINIKDGIIEKVLYKEENSNVNNFLKINNNSTLLAYGNDKGLIRLFDLRTNKHISKFESNELALSLYINDNDLIYIINNEYISKWNISFDNHDLSSDKDKEQPLKQSSSSTSLLNYPLSLQSKIKINLKSSPITTSNSNLFNNIHINSDTKYIMLPNFNENEINIYNVNNGEYEISSDKFSSDIECFDVNQNFTQSVVGCTNGSLYLNRWLYV
ncbi:WD40 repeat-like protein [Anaeromyces robustus]|uniref:WD40 repeat-like protein n=1 Tax=Anaeromyces robustus TaxID=1754192 RepID=A0A1Y1WXZ5_9FUNG|nr:WD40 repeat-like protein [Anaeromyces robustus]|eukprot:ORX78437.1 WD40 repeat-like protein [Anaeromyces robustus]